MPLSDRRLASVPDAPDAGGDPVAPAPKPRRRTRTGGVEPVGAAGSGGAAGASEALPKPAALPKTADKLAKLGLKSDIDLVLHLPMRYEDETTLTPIGELIPGDNAQTEGVVFDNEIAYRPRRQLLVKIHDDAGDELDAALSQFLRLAGEADGDRRAPARARRCARRLFRDGDGASDGASRRRRHAAAAGAHAGLSEHGGASRRRTCARRSTTRSRARRCPSCCPSRSPERYLQPLNVPALARRREDAAPSARRFR